MISYDVQILATVSSKNFNIIEDYSPFVEFIVYDILYYVI
jgi:hypothetical protein